MEFLGSFFGSEKKGKKTKINTKPSLVSDTSASGLPRSLSNDASPPPQSPTKKKDKEKRFGFLSELSRSSTNSKPPPKPPKPPSDKPSQDSHANASTPAAKGTPIHRRSSFSSSLSTDSTDAEKEAYLASKDHHHSSTSKADATLDHYKHYPVYEGKVSGKKLKDFVKFPHLKHLDLWMPSKQLEHQLSVFQVLLKKKYKKEAELIGAVKHISMELEALPAFSSHSVPAIFILLDIIDLLLELVVNVIRFKDKKHFFMLIVQFVSRPELFNFACKTKRQVSDKVKQDFVDRYGHTLSHLFVFITENYKGDFAPFKKFASQIMAILFLNSQNTREFIISNIIAIIEKKQNVPNMNSKSKIASAIEYFRSAITQDNFQSTFPAPSFSHEDVSEKTILLSPPNTKTTTLRNIHSDAPLPSFQKRLDLYHDAPIYVYPWTNNIVIPELLAPEARINEAGNSSSATANQPRSVFNKAAATTPAASDTLIAQKKSGLTRQNALGFISICLSGNGELCLDFIKSVLVWYNYIFEHGSLFHKRKLGSAFWEECPCYFELMAIIACVSFKKENQINNLRYFSVYLSHVLYSDIFVDYAFDVDDDTNELADSEFDPVIDDDPLMNHSHGKTSFDPSLINDLRQDMSGIPPTYNKSLLDKQNHAAKQFGPSVSEANRSSGERLSQVLRKMSDFFINEDQNLFQDKEDPLKPMEPLSLSSTSTPASRRSSNPKLNLSYVGANTYSSIDVAPRYFKNRETRLLFRSEHVSDSEHSISPSPVNNRETNTHGKSNSGSTSPFAKRSRSRAPSGSSKNPPNIFSSSTKHSGTQSPSPTATSECPSSEEYILPEQNPLLLDTKNSIYPHLAYDFSDVLGRHPSVNDLGKGNHSDGQLFSFGPKTNAHASGLKRNASLGYMKKTGSASSASSSSSTSSTSSSQRPSTPVPLAVSVVPDAGISLMPHLTFSVLHKLAKNNPESFYLIFKFLIATTNLFDLNDVLVSTFYMQSYFVNINKKMKRRYLVPNNMDDFEVTDFFKFLLGSEHHRYNMIALNCIVNLKKYFTDPLYIKVYHFILTKCFKNLSCHWFVGVRACFIRWMVTSIIPLTRNCDLKFILKVFNIKKTLYTHELYQETLARNATINPEIFRLLWAQLILVQRIYIQIVKTTPKEILDKELDQKMLLEVVPEDVVAQTHLQDTGPETPIWKPKISERHYFMMFSKELLFYLVYMKTWAADKPDQGLLTDATDWPAELAMPNMLG